MAFQKENTAKNKKRRILLLLIGAVALIATAFAFMTATDSKDNVFTIGKVDIEVVEPGWYNEDGELIDDNDHNGINDFAENVIPGDSIDKAPYIKNTGENEAWIYAVIRVPAATEEQFLNETAADGSQVISVIGYAIQDQYGSSKATGALNVWNAFAPDIDDSATEGGEIYSKFELINLHTGSDDSWMPICKDGDAWIEGNAGYASSDGYVYYVFAQKDLVDTGAQTEPVFEKVKYIGEEFVKPVNIKYLDGDNDPFAEYEAQEGNDIPEPSGTPEKEGETFGGWVTTDETEPEIVGEENITYVPSFGPGEYTITYFVPVRDADEHSSTYGKLIGWEQYDTPKMVTSGSTIGSSCRVANPEVTFYDFNGWMMSENGEILDDLPNTMPEHNIILYANCTRQQVYLIPKAASTRIDRGLGYYGNGTSYSIEDGGVVRNTTQEYFEYDPTTSVWYVYGIALRCTEENLGAEYVDVAGDGYYVLTPSYTSGAGVNYAGTGARIDVYDRVTGELVETFYVVVFGDINGDGYYVTSDVSAIKQDVSWDNNFSSLVSVSEPEKTAMMMSADLERNMTITTADATALQNVVAHLGEINQINGAFTYEP